MYFGEADVERQRLVTMTFRRLHERRISGVLVPFDQGLAESRVAQRHCRVTLYGLLKQVCRSLQVFFLSRPIQVVSRLQVQVVGDRIVCRILSQQFTNVTAENDT